MTDGVDGLAAQWGATQVGGPHLHQPGATLPQHVGDAEPAPDLHGLSSGDHHLSPSGHGGQRQEHGGGVVVDGQGRLCANELPDEPGDVRLA